MTTTEQNVELGDALAAVRHFAHQVKADESRRLKGHRATLEDDLALAGALQDLIEAASHAQRDAVEQARGSRATWAEVGKAVRRSAQAAQQRFGKG